MRSLNAVLILVPCLTSLGACRRTTVTLTCRPPAAGSTWATKYSSRGITRRNAPDAGASEETPFEQRSTVRTVVLATSATMVTRIKVTWESAARITSFLGQEIRVPFPMEGKTYVYERRGNEILVTTDAGEPVPADQTGLAASPDSMAGSPPAFQALSGRTFTAGQPVTLSADELRAAAVGASPPATVTRSRLTFVGMSGDMALFRSELETEGPPPGQKARWSDVVSIDPRTCALDRLKTDLVQTAPDGSLTEVEMTLQRLP